MSASQYDGTNMTLGQFIREARLARGLSLEELGEPELSGHYVDATERGAVLPSRMALEALARHFVVPVTELLRVQGKLETEPDLQAIEEDLHLQLNYVNSLIDAREIDEALQLINIAEQDNLYYMEYLSWRARYHVRYLRGMSYLRTGRLSEAQSQIEAAIAEVGPDFDAEARIHNLLGVAYYLQGNPQKALEQHQIGLRAAEDGKLKDLNLRLSICRNLANAHWGLNNFEEAIRFYNESLITLQDLNDIERQAGVYWGMMMTYRAWGDTRQAKLCGLKALEIYAAGHDIGSTASMCVSLAEMNIQDRQYDEARTLLKRAEKLLEGTDELLILSGVYQGFAQLASAQGQLDEAARYGAQAVEFGEASCEKTASHDMQARGIALRAYAEALNTAAQIDEARNNPDAADRLFKQAIATIEQTSFEETRSEIIFSYAEVLKGRGEHELAGAYYRMGFESRQGSDAQRV